MDRTLDSDSQIPVRTAVVQVGKFPLENRGPVIPVTVSFSEI